MKAQGHCRTCRQLFILRKDGAVREHLLRFGRRPYRRCKGGSKWPLERAMPKFLEAACG